MPLNNETEQAVKDHEQEVFDHAFDEAEVRGNENDHLAESLQTREAPNNMYTEFITPLATSLRGKWTIAEGDRRSTEQRMLRDLRQYRGIYDPEILNKMHPKRSKAFIRLTRSKVRAVDSRIMDLQFPANKEKNWSIDTTPVPEIDPQQLEQLAAAYFQELKKVPQPDDLRRITMNAARERAGNMEKEIEDQLVEFKYRDVIRKVVHSGNLYGTGVMKGPIVKEKSRKHWVKIGNQWKLVTKKSIMPFAQHVPVWDIYPDMSAKEPEDMAHVFHRHLMGKHKLIKLSKRSDFNRQAILAYMETKPDGDAEWKQYEDHMREMSSNTNAKYPESQIPKNKKYEVIEYWGMMDTNDVEEELGIVLTAEDGFKDPEVMVNAWMLGPMIIKMVVSPIEGSKFPFFFYYFDKDETHIFGDGIPAIMRDPQSMLNASVRAMLDNAAISAGPIIEANIDLLADGEDPNDVYPFRSFQRTGIGTDGSNRAITVTKLPSYTSQFMTMVDFFRASADETTNIPSAMAGQDGNQMMGAAGRTATGLSMLMGSANITLKDQLKNFDDGITKPFIKALYFWNMEFNPKEDIKGDFSVVARGSASLVAKEVRLESLNQFLAIVANDPEAHIVLDRRTLYDEYLKILDLDDVGLLRSEDEIANIRQQQSIQADKDREFDQQERLLKAQSGGHVPGAAGGVIVDPQGRPAMQNMDQQALREGQAPEIIQP